MDTSEMHLVHGFSRFSFAFLSLFSFLLLQSATGKELKFVVTVFRHGDRTPVATFPTFPFKDSVWPQGFGQLTKTGMREQFLLGGFLKKRYKNFLSSAYKPQEIYVRSTDFDRTIMSAQANLAGFFPPTGKQIWNSKILWQPIPVHTVPIKDDKLLAFPTRGCNRFNQLLKETMGTKEVQTYIQTSMKFIAKMANYMGYDVKTLLDFNNHKLWNAYDILLVAKKHRVALPSWAGKHAMDRLKKLMEFALTAIFGIHKREEKSRLQGGILVKAILDKITKASQSDDGPKMIMYSAHDTTIAALQVALDVFNRKLPPYASCHIFELYKEDNGYTVEMYYQNATYSDPHQLILPGCTGACPLEKFTELVSPVITNDWEGECNKVS